jgi:protein-tyrosine phosphatase
VNHVIDLHCHVLPGIDDGPATIEASVALVRAAAAAGVRVMVATPHVSWRYPNEAPTIARLTGELNERLRQERIAVEIRPGAEIAMTRAGDIDRAELPRLGIGGGPWLLLEPPFTPLVTGLDTVVLGLQSDGYRILLAHPERCPAFHSDPEVLRSLVRAGALTSITAGSLVGRFSSEVRRFALNMVAEELVHNVASDAHDEVRRPPGIAAELEQAGLGPLNDWLTLDVPEAILSGEPIPPRPAFTIPRIERSRRRMWPHRH